MKTLTCAMMGGMCDEKMSADTQDEMIMKGIEHLRVAHPEMHASVMATPKEDPKMVEWKQQFDKTWAETPDA